MTKRRAEDLDLFEFSARIIEQIVDTCKANGEDTVSLEALEGYVQAIRGRGVEEQVNRIFNSE